MAHLWAGLGKKHDTTLVPHRYHTGTSQVARRTIGNQHKIDLLRSGHNLLTFVRAALPSTRKTHAPHWNSTGATLVPTRTTPVPY